MTFANAISGVTAGAVPVFRVQDARDVDVTLAADEDGKALVYDHASGDLVLESLEYNRVLRSTKDLPDYGAEMVANGDFATGDFTGWTAGAGWSVSSGKALHTAGNTATLSQTVTQTDVSGVADRQLCYLAFTISGRTAGSVSVTLNSVSAETLDGVTTFSTNATHTTIVNVGTTTAAISLVITPTSDFDGSLDNISVKNCGYTVPFLTFVDTYGGTPIDVNGYHGSATFSMGVGRRSLQRNRAVGNAGFGNATLSRNVIGTDNTAFGNSALAMNTIGVNNAAIGSGAMLSNVSGQSNVGIGGSSLYSSTSGYRNTAVGAATMVNNATGYRNTVIGAFGLYYATAPEYVVTLGASALFFVTTASRVIAIGASSGLYQAGGTTPLTSVSNSIYIGDIVKGVEGEANAVVIGHQAESIGSNKTVIGNSSTTVTALFGALRLPQLDAAPTGEAGHALIYAKDNGGGKMQLCCKLGDDVEIVLGTQA